MAEGPLRPPLPSRDLLLAKVADSFSVSLSLSLASSFSFQKVVENEEVNE
jgi:hypothetical protein